MSPSHCLETQTATNIKFRFALRFTPIAILAIFQEFLSNSYKNKKPRQSFDYQGFNQVGMTGFEPATTRPPDAYSNRAELHPALFSFAKVHKKQ